MYRIDASTLAELDALRTKGGEYARHLIQTPYGGSAWMYVYQRPVEGFTLIENGNWLDRDQYYTDGNATSVRLAIPQWQT